MELLPLHNLHCQLGAIMKPYRGIILPIYYEKIYREHLRVRVAAGMADLSWLDILRVSGDGTDAYLDGSSTRILSDLPHGRWRYTLFLSEQGAVLTDAICMRDEAGFIITTPRGCAGLITGSNPPGAGVTVLPDTETVIIGVMGRKAGIVLQRFTDVDLPRMRTDEFVDGFIGRIRVRIVRTAFTGEDTFEIHVQKSSAVEIWNRIMRGGSEIIGLVGCAAINTLRVEAFRPVPGSELTLDIGPLELGLDRYLDSDRTYTGSGAVAAMRAGGPPRRLTAILIDSPRIAWRGTQIFSNNNPIGSTTTGAAGLTLQRSIAMALVAASSAHTGKEVQVRLGRQVATGVIIKPPFYKKERR